MALYCNIPTANTSDMLFPPWPTPSYSFTVQTVQRLCQILCSIEPSMILATNHRLATPATNSSPVTVTKPIVPHMKQLCRLKFATNPIPRQLEHRRQIPHLWQWHQRQIPHLWQWHRRQIPNQWQWHRWQIPHLSCDTDDKLLTCNSDIGDKFLTWDNDTDDKFLTSNSDIGDKFLTWDNDTDDKFLISDSDIRDKVLARDNDTDVKFFTSDNDTGDKFLTCDSDIGDNFLSSDSDIGDNFLTNFHIQQCFALLGFLQLRLSRKCYWPLWENEERLEKDFRNCTHMRGMTTGRPGRVHFSIEIGYFFHC